ncbi:MAG: hypothetical protein M3071_09200 [Actinomycetota bacterium]|nr:hypothetical protein [Actinomycetota bacterium]
MKLLSETSVPVCATGRLTVSFSGDRATGCAARGSCGYSGTESWQPRGGGVLDVVSYRSHGRRGFAATLLLGASGSPVLASVGRATGTAAPSVCRDSSDAFGGFFSPTVSDGRLAVRLGEGGTPLLGTRCAGPLEVDLSAALPAATLSVRSALQGQTVLDLTGTHAFAADGFAGVVGSTIVLRLGRPSRSSPPGPSGTSPPRGERMRSVTVAYRLEGLTGSAVAQVGASPDPAACGPLDACGLGGTIGVAPGPATAYVNGQGTIIAARGAAIDLTAIGPARRPYRDFLAALGLSARGDRAGIAVGGGGEVRLHGLISADLHQGRECRDTTRLFSAAVTLRAGAGRVRLSFAPAASQASDPLRTRCPGPALVEHDLASATEPLSALRPPALTVALRGATFGDGVYRVRPTSTLVLTLRRTRISSATYTLGLGSLPTLNRLEPIGGLRPAH